MARNRQRRLQAVYDQVPAVGCKGLCHRFCCVVPWAKVELERVDRNLTGPFPIAVGNVHICPLLSEEGRCGQYEDRPLICRLWGAVENLQCPHGCRPERLLTRAEAFGLLSELTAIDGGESQLVPWSPGVGQR